MELIHHEPAREAASRNARRAQILPLKAAAASPPGLPQLDELSAAREWQLRPLDQLSDEDLIRRCREQPAQRACCLDVLFARVYPRVVQWCLRYTRQRDDAADLAQEVVLRAYTRLDSFRLESKFSTWLYTVSRRVAIDHGIERRREGARRASLQAANPAEDALTTSEVAELLQVGAAVRDAMIVDLDPLEAQVVYLHHVDGLPLPAITELLDLGNKSGAKAYLVRGMRKLRRRFRGLPGNES